MLITSLQNKKNVLLCCVICADKSHLELTAAVKGLLWSSWIQPDLRMWLSSQFDIFLYFSMERKKKNHLTVVMVCGEKHLKLQLSPASYLARWSTASTMFVPSLALVSQNRAPYACRPKNGQSEDSSVYLESVSLKLFPLDWNPQHTLASFSPCRVLTQLPSGRCSRRSTLFPTTHIGILSSVESCRETEEAETGSSWPAGSHVWPFGSYLDLFHPSSDAEKAVLWSNVVEEQDSVSFTEIGPGNATKPIKNKFICSAVCLATALYGLSFIYLSWPAVSHICRLVFSPSTSMFFIWKSTPDQKRKKMFKSERKDQ